jgi:hypothetical protein
MVTENRPKSHIVDFVCLPGWYTDKSFRILIGFGFECRYIGVRIRIGNGADSDRKQK